MNIKIPLQVTTLMRRPNARLSTSAPLTGPEVWPSTASSAPTEPFSTRTTSSATGGSMLTVPSPPPSPRPRTRRSPPPGMLWPRPLPQMLSSLTPPQPRSRRSPLPLTLLEDTLHPRSMNTMTKLLTEALLPTLEDSRNVP